MKIAGLVFLIVGLHIVLPSYAQDELDFAHDILPVLKNRCVSCHANGKYEGGFSIDTREAILYSGSIDSDRPDDSELLLRILSDDGEYRMPPDGNALTAEQVELFKKWIAADLPWQPGFSFRESNWQPPLKYREVSVAVGDEENPVDRILAKYFEQHGCEPPGPVADSVFVRRVWLDLVGLLPTLEEQEAFTGDPDPAKRDKLIDALLARRRDYADHWLTFWNDLLRNDYSGTGYIDGGRKQITRWLHRSLYENKPYDQFVRELISPGPESDGFIRGIRWRGDVNASQRVELQFAQNVSQVFLGENLKCASCHDSFIDNWKLTDAWSMAAIIADGPLETVRCDHPTGTMASPAFVWPQMGTISVNRPPEERLAELSRLITGPNNGRFARTIANRIWQRMMGRGIIEPVDVMANQPFDADLIDFLACYLRDHDFDLKQVIRLIATSRAYQATVVLEPETPSGGGVFRGPVIKRLTAEQFCDIVWRLTETTPEQARAEIDDYGDPPVPVRAALVDSNLLMRELGRPNREQVVTTRGQQLSTLQALTLSNGRPFFEIVKTGGRNWLDRYPDRDPLISEFVQLALCRQPTETETKLLRQIVGSPSKPDSVADLIWTVLMLPEFQYVQ